MMKAPQKQTQPERWWRCMWLRLLMQEDLNFLLTNRVPRMALTVLMGRISRIRSPMFTAMAIRAWRLFTPLDLSEAAEQRFDSIQACFTRALRPGVRPIDPRPNVLVSPCDGLLGAHGVVAQGQMLQAKGMPYSLEALLGHEETARRCEGRSYATLRLTSSMYHRFHAPSDGQLVQVRHIHGDTWNVNPIALKRVSRLFCRNERAVLSIAVAPAGELLLVPVAAILVAGLRLHALSDQLGLMRTWPNEVNCQLPHRRGDELGWFEHGSTIIVIAPAGYQLRGEWALGAAVQMGQALFERTSDLSSGLPRALSPPGHIHTPT